MAISTSDHHDHHHAVSKPLSKWFANKTLKLSFHRRRSKSSSSCSSSPSSPISPLRTPRTSPTTTIAIIGTNKEDELRQVFRRFDQNDDGKISAFELRAYFGSVGEYMSHEQAKGVINDFDSDGDDLIDFQDFLKLMKRDDHDHQDLKNAFEMFELEKGCITPRSLQRMLGKLGDAKSYDECVAMIQVFDTDGNGVLDFNEFHQMMT
ncbi:putative calcium-binding protein CML41 [Morus notabilis]|uniref:Putative calcium-binding protein CML41 n=1 Tax=Morus notabilis TaxID=981085 RepID=W9R9U4_9ROSA|nr:probable calcium-binding protein CML41 [Morus notabilis]EXB77868.1 putative calcium-binding protein CML41 [Morus notabilis]